MSQDSSVDHAIASVIPHHEIRELAYHLWDRNHRPGGYELEFWLMAERDLKAEQRASQDGNQVEAPDGGRH